MSTFRIFSSRASLLLTALPLAWSGCNLAPKYSRPAVETPSQFKESGPATPEPGVAWNAAHPQDDASRGRWWEAYGDQELNSLEGQVEGANQTVRSAEANFRAARAAVSSARAAFFPLISAYPSFTRARASQTVKSAASSSAALAPGGATNTSSVINTYSLPFDASYEVDFWGRIRNTVNVSAANALASAADFATALLSTQAELAQDYFQLRTLDAQRQILDDTVASYRKSLDETSSLYRAGIDSDEDVARAQTQLNTAIAQATDVGVSRASFEHAIAVLIGKAPSGFSLAAVPLAVHPPSVPTGLPSSLLERRPDIASAERRVAAANAQIGIARAAYFPTLDLGVSGGWESSQFSRWFEWPSRFWTLAPQLAGTIFDGGARRAHTEQARAEFDQTVAQYRQTVLSAFQTVEDNVATLRILEQEAREQRIAVDSSRHLLELANTRFKLGIDSYLNVITAQTALLSNRETELQIQLRRTTASISLIKALGGGWDVSQLSSTTAVATTAAGGPPKS